VIWYPHDPFSFPGTGPEDVQVRQFGSDDDEGHMFMQSVTATPIPILANMTKHTILLT